MTHEAQFHQMPAWQLIVMTSCTDLHENLAASLVTDARAQTQTHG